MPLKLSLKPGERFVLNGAVVQNGDRRSVLVLQNKASVLREKDIMQPEEVNSPARRIYFALQSAYIGSVDERPDGLRSARDLIEAFKTATTSTLARDILDRALAAAEADDCYQALKLTRRIIVHEDAVLGRVPDQARVVAQDATRAHPTGMGRSLKTEGRHEHATLHAGSARL